MPCTISEELKRTADALETVAKRLPRAKPTCQCIRGWNSIKMPTCPIHGDKAKRTQT